MNACMLHAFCLADIYDGRCRMQRLWPATLEHYMHVRHCVGVLWLDNRDAVQSCRPTTTAPSTDAVLFNIEFMIYYFSACETDDSAVRGAM